MSNTTDIFTIYDESDILENVSKPTKVIYTHPRRCLGHLLSYSFYSSGEEFIKCNPTDVCFIGFLKD